jgi:hypothetical protein
MYGRKRKSRNYKSSRYIKLLKSPWIPVTVTRLQEAVPDPAGKPAGRFNSVFLDWDNREV